MQICICTRKVIKMSLQICVIVVKCMRLAFLLLWYSDRAYCSSYTRIIFKLTQVLVFNFYVEWMRSSSPTITTYILTPMPSQRMLMVEIINRRQKKTCFIFYNEHNNKESLTDLNFICGFFFASVVGIHKHFFGFF